MDLRASLVKARELLTPTGAIAVVGVSANKTVREWVWTSSCVPAARLHCQTRNIGVVVTDPSGGSPRHPPHRRRHAAGASLRRALYYRYLLRWVKRLMVYKRCFPSKPLVSQ
jgi:hypothetical protein